MPTSTFTRFNSFSEGLAKKEHNCHTDTFKCMLSNAAPNVSTMVNKADATEISAGNGYTAGGDDTQNVVSRTGAVSSVVTTDITVTASGGSVGPFRYGYVYNDTHTSKALVGYFDYGSSITLGDGESFVEDFGTSLFTIG